MNVLVVGNGGREHALGWKLAQDGRVRRLFFAPGNAGTSALGTNLDLKASDVEGLAAWCAQHRPDRVVVGPEAPLCLGLVDRLEAIGIRAFGPNQSAARLEGSKIFTKELLNKAGIPTARSRRFTALAPALAGLSEFSLPVVVKADGLAAGKGVIIAQSRAEAEEALRDMLERKVFAAAGEAVLVEEFLDGEEASIHALTDGDSYVLLPSSQDHKRVGEGDTGLNTGGMGAYAPAPVVTPEILAQVEREVFVPLLKAFKEEGIDYRGVLYGGLMLTAAGPKVLEFNCRFGDPETEVLLPLLETPLLDLIDAVIDRRLAGAKLKTREGSALTVVLAAPGYPENPRVGGKLEGLEARAANGMIFHAGTRAENGGAASSGGRVLAVSGWGASLEEARTASYGLLGRVKLEGGHFRRDIGHRALKK
jgi:phosphoribosylamine--glycine ligase